MPYSRNDFFVTLVASKPPWRLSPLHTRASGWARRLACPFAQQIAVVFGEFSWELCLARSWGKKLSCLIFCFVLTGQWKHTIFFTWFNFIMFLPRNREAHADYHCCHILLSFFLFFFSELAKLFWMNQGCRYRRNISGPHWLLKEKTSENYSSRP